MPLKRGDPVVLPRASRPRQSTWTSVPNWVWSPSPGEIQRLISHAIFPENMAMHVSKLEKSTWIVAILLLTVTGCNSSTDPALVPAGGVINYQGRPLPGAKVTFVPEKMGGLAMATTDSAGKFKLKTGVESGVAVGSCKVSVMMMEGSDEGGLPKSMTPEDMQKMQIEGKLQTMLADREKKSLIPKRYGNAESSGLTYEIKASGENQFTIDLSD